MAVEGLRSASTWLAAGTALAALAFGLLAFAMLDLAVFAGLAASLVVAVAGGRVAAAMREVPEDERIRYPFDLAQRGQRLAWTSLIAAIGIAGYGLAPGAVEASLGPVLLVFVGAAALLAPAMAVMLLVWTADGLSLRTGREEPGDPLVAASASMAVALALALVTATTGYDVGFALIVALGGLVPCLFVAWSLQRIGAAMRDPIA